MGKAKLTVRTTDLGSVINDCEYKHYNKGARKDIPNVNWMLCVNLPRSIVTDQRIATLEWF